MILSIFYMTHKFNINSEQNNELVLKSLSQIEPNTYKTNYHPGGPKEDAHIKSTRWFLRWSKNRSVGSAYLNSVPCIYPNSPNSQSASDHPPTRSLGFSDRQRLQILINS